MGGGPAAHANPSFIFRACMSNVRNLTFSLLTTMEMISAVHAAMCS